MPMATSEYGASFKVGDFVVRAQLEGGPKFVVLAMAYAHGEWFYFVQSVTENGTATGTPNTVAERWLSKYEDKWKFGQTYRNKRSQDYWRFVIDHVYDDGSATGHFLDVKSAVYRSAGERKNYEEI